MSSVSTVKPSDDSAQNKEVVASTTSFTHDAGEFSSSAAMVTSQTTEQPKFYQQVPDNEIQHFLERSVELYTISLQGTDTPISIVAKKDVWTDFLAKASVAAKTQNYTLIRGTLELTFVVNAQPSAYGSYVFAALCDGEPSDTTTDVAVELEPRNCMQVDHYFRFDCASAENGVMQLPWVYPYDYAELPTGPAGMWQLYLVCLAPILSGLTGAAASGSVRVFARLMPGYVLSVPQFQGGPRRGGHLQPSSSTATHTPKLHQQLKQMQANHTISSTADKIAGVADKLSAIPVIGSAASTVAVAAHAASRIAHAFGFSRDTAPKPPMPIAMRSVTNVARYEGDDASEVAAFSQVCEISPDPTMAGSTPEDIMSFASLFARWTLVKRITWSQTAASGTDLGNVPVSPSYCDNRASDNAYCMTTAGYIGAPFQKWRGDMEYLVVIPASKFHRGSLQVFWVPTGSSPTADVTNTTLNAIIDLGSGEEHQFKIGFARGRTYCDNQLISPLFVINTNWCNGRLFFRVINPLIASNTSADTSLLIFARAGANMDFAVPRVTSVDQLSNIQAWEYAYSQVQGGALGDEDEHDVKTHELVASSGPYPSTELLFGEQITSTRALMQKPSLLRNTYTGTSPAATLNAPLATTFFPPLGTLCTGQLTTTQGPYLVNTKSIWDGSFTFQGWLRPLFTGIATSERFKTITTAGQNYFSAARLNMPSVGGYAPPLSTTQVPMSTLLPTSAVGSNLGYEVSVPYYCVKKFLLGRRYYGPTNAESIATQIMAIASNNTAPVARYFHSYGPDIRVVGFRQVPPFTTGASFSTVKWGQFFQQMTI